VVLSDIGGDVLVHKDYPKGYPSNYKWHIMGFTSPRQTVNTVCYDQTTESPGGLRSCIEWALRKGAVEIHISRGKKLGRKKPRI